jgi:hypothetical protein
MEGRERRVESVEDVLAAIAGTLAHGQIISLLHRCESRSRAHPAIEQIATSCESIVVIARSPGQFLVAQITAIALRHVEIPRRTFALRGRLKQHQQGAISQSLSSMIVP